MVTLLVFSSNLRTCRLQQLLFGSSAVDRNTNNEQTGNQLASEVTWVVKLLAELVVDKLTSVALHYDYQSVIHIVKNSIFYEKQST